MKTKYSKDFPLAAEGLARSGLIDKQIAKKLGISISRFYHYQNKYQEFQEAIKKGKSPVDTKVENALLKRALGYECEEICTEYEMSGKTEGKKAFPTKVKKTKKEVVADVTAQIFWLKNRKPEKWRDRHEHEFPKGLDVRLSLTDFKKSMRRIGNGN